MISNKMKRAIVTITTILLFYGFLALTIAFSEGVIGPTSFWYALRYPVYVICGIMGLALLLFASTLLYLFIFGDKETKVRGFFERIAKYYVKLGGGEG